MLRRCKALLISLTINEISVENHAGFGLEHRITKLENGRCEPRLAQMANELIIDTKIS